MNEEQLKDELENIRKHGWFCNVNILELIKTFTEQKIVNQKTKQKLSILDCIHKCKSPKHQNIFAALKLFNPAKTKIVILGQDPYPKPNDAHGLAFSSPNKNKKDSLENIFKAVDEYTGKTKEHTTDLTNWAMKNKVLLLNTALTFESGDNKTKLLHINAWKPFIELVIKEVSKNKNLAVFLWGKKAQKYKKMFRGNAKIFETYHPSKINSKNIDKFIEDSKKHFKECEEILGIDAWQKI